MAPIIIRTLHDFICDLGTILSYNDTDTTLTMNAFQAVFADKLIDDDRIPVFTFTLMNNTSYGLLVPKPVLFAQIFVVRNSVTQKVIGNTSFSPKNQSESIASPFIYQIISTSDMFHSNRIFNSNG